LSDREILYFQSIIEPRTHQQKIAQRESIGLAFPNDYAPLSGKIAKEVLRILWWTKHLYPELGIIVRFDGLFCFSFPSWLFAPGSRRWCRPKSAVKQGLPRRQPGIETKALLNLLRGRITPL